MRGVVLAATVLLAVWVGVGALPGVASANIVVNGGFETGTLAGWTINPNADNPWFVTQTYDLGPGYPNSGLFYATSGCVGMGCLDPTTGNFLTQDLPTIPLQTYNLSFAYNPYIDGPAELQAMWNGTTVFDLATADPSDPGYTVYTVDDLLATSSSTPLTFLGRQDPNFDGLDDISVSVTPEPSSLALFASVLPGLVGVGALGLRRLRARGGTTG